VGHILLGVRCAFWYATSCGDGSEYTEFEQNRPLDYDDVIKDLKIPYRCMENGAITANQYFISL